ncbi:hypothetical protein [Streptomyces sp. NPDC054961]
MRLQETLGALVESGAESGDQVAAYRHGSPPTGSAAPGEGFRHVIDAWPALSWPWRALINLR